MARRQLLALHHSPSSPPRCPDGHFGHVALRIDYEFFHDESEVPCGLKTIDVMYQKDEVIKVLFLEWLMDMAYTPRRRPSSGWWLLGKYAWGKPQGKHAQHGPDH